MKIFLFCSGGMSTTLLVSKMQKLIQTKGMDCEVAAFAETLAATKGHEADIVLLAPQIRFREKAIREALPNKFIQLINMRDYGIINAENVLSSALEGYDKFKA